MISQSGCVNVNESDSRASNLNFFIESGRIKILYPNDLVNVLWIYLLQVSPRSPLLKVHKVNAKADELQYTKRHEDCFCACIFEGWLGQIKCTAVLHIVNSKKQNNTWQLWLAFIIIHRIESLRRYGWRDPMSSWLKLVSPTVCQSNYSSFRLFLFWGSICPLIQHSNLLKQSKKV